MKEGLLQRYPRLMSDNTPVNNNTNLTHQLAEHTSRSSDHRPISRLV